MKRKGTASPALTGVGGVSAPALDSPDNPSEGGGFFGRLLPNRTTRLAQIEEELGRAGLSEVQRDRLENEQTALVYSAKLERARLRMLDPATSAADRARLAQALNPFAGMDDELMEDGQCRALYAKLLKSGKWRNAQSLMEKLVLALVHPDNADKLLALVALKSLSSAKPGAKWAKAVNWLLIRWNWISLTSQHEAASGYGDVEPLIGRRPNKQQSAIIQRMLWDLLPLIYGNEKQWQRAKEDEHVRDQIIEGTYKSAAAAADIGISESAMRHRLRRDKRAKKSGG